jgi:hypothetical protein
MVSLQSQYTHDRSSLLALEASTGHELASQRIHSIQWVHETQPKGPFLGRSGVEKLLQERWEISNASWIGALLMLWLWRGT